MEYYQILNNPIANFVIEICNNISKGLSQTWGKSNNLLGLVCMEIQETGAKGDNMVKLASIKHVIVWRN